MIMTDPINNVLKYISPDFIGRYNAAKEKEIADPRNRHWYNQEFIQVRRNGYNIVEKDRSRYEESRKLGIGAWSDKCAFPGHVLPLADAVLLRVAQLSKALPHAKGAEDSETVIEDANDFNSFIQTKMEHKTQSSTSKSYFDDRQVEELTHVHSGPISNVAHAGSANEKFGAGTGVHAADYEQLMRNDNGDHQLLSDGQARALSERSGASTASSLIQTSSSHIKQTPDNSTSTAPEHVYNGTGNGFGKFSDGNGARVSPPWQENSVQALESLNTSRYYYNVFYERDCWFLCGTYVNCRSWSYAVCDLDLEPCPYVAGTCALYTTDEVVYTPSKFRDRLHTHSWVDRHWVYGARNCPETLVKEQDDYSNWFVDRLFMFGPYVAVGTFFLFFGMFIATRKL